MAYNLPYQNFHRHSFYTNIIIPDSACSIEQYAVRAKELGHGILSSIEHGWQGNYYKTYEIAKEYGLKFIFGTEAYWVSDRKEKDATNCHICLLAKNEQGRREINETLADANISGFYKVPRIDLLLLSRLSRKNVFLTSSCVAFFKYGIEETRNIILKLFNHFKDSFYLEIQCHDMTRQKEVNKEILSLHEDYKIPIILGVDSHYIYPKDSKERDNVLQAKGITYQNEENCILDYPDSNTLIKRFKKQGIVPEEKVIEAINNTNLILEFEDIEFNKNIKLPTIYPNKNKNEKNKIFKDLIEDKWNQYKLKIPQENWAIYQEEIKKEVQCVINTGMTDYFLLDYEILQEALKKGGRITLTGRGSSASFFINTLLGFSKIDRIASPIKMYPERFMSESRILETKSLPDLDLNTGDPEPFLEAQQEILGENSSFQMIAFGQFKVKSAFKLYAKAMNISFEIANNITKQIEQYELALKHTDDADKESIQLYNYIDEKYLHLIKESEKYQNIISDKKPHPCASLIYQGNIKKDIGIMRIKNNKKDIFVTVIDGAMADKYKFLKNDLLTVDVVNIIYNTFETINKETFTVNELNKICKDDDRVWNIYKNGKTVCLNQVEKESTKEKVIRYQPRNISELTSFIAAIRPSFQSMYSIFERKEKFIYGIKAFDDILQTKDIKSSFLLYQEQIMATLSFAGIKTSETYGIIKAIAKKKSEQVKKWKDIFIEGFKKQILQTENIVEEKALEKTLQVWKIIDDSCAYGFNASHAYSVACDSLYCCYLKAYYPLEFFETALNYYSTKAAKDKITEIKKEAETFNIKIKAIEFRSDNRKFKADKENFIINEDMTSIKHLNKQISNELYKLRNKEYYNFFEILEDLNIDTGIQSNQLEILIKLNYFIEFGSIGLLLSHVELFNKLWQKNSKSYRKQISKDKIKDLNLNENIIKRLSKETPKMYTCINSKEILKSHLDFIEEKKFTEADLINTELEYLGYIRYLTKMKQDRHKVFILDIDMGNSEVINPKIIIYSIGTGKIAKLKIKRNFCAFKKNDIIQIIQIKSKPRYIFEGTNNNGKPIFRQSKTEKDWWIEKWKWI